MDILTQWAATTLTLHAYALLWRAGIVEVSDVLTSDAISVR